MNSEWWRTGFPPADIPRYGSVRLTRAERAVLKRLREGETSRRAARRIGRIGYRSALRRRRRALDTLDDRDVQRLLQIMVELGL